MIFITGPPPAPFGVESSLEETDEDFVSFNLTWNSNFNSDYAVTFYIITPDSTTEGSSVIRCPQSCYPDVPCQCNGLARGERMTINVSAVNCGNQEGIAAAVGIISPGMKNL